jgi:hypothetical protein
MNSDESVELQELSLDLCSTNLEMKRLLSLSLIESSSRSEEGSGIQSIFNEIHTNVNACVKIAMKSLTAPFFNV